MGDRMGTWMEERTGWRGVRDTVFLRNIPKVNWLYTLGSATLIVLVNQFVTGILLTIYYVPAPQDAYDTVQFITPVLLQHHSRRNSSSVSASSGISSSCTIRVSREPTPGPSI